MFKMYLQLNRVQDDNLPLHKAIEITVKIVIQKNVYYSFQFTLLVPTYILVKLQSIPACI